MELDLWVNYLLKKILMEQVGGCRLCCGGPSFGTSLPQGKGELHSHNLIRFPCLNALFRYIVYLIHTAGICEL